MNGVKRVPNSWSSSADRAGTEKKVIAGTMDHTVYLPPNTSHTCLYFPATEHHLSLAGTQFPFHCG